MLLSVAAHCSKSDPPLQDGINVVDSLMQLQPLEGIKVLILMYKDRDTLIKQSQQLIWLQWLLYSVECLDPFARFLLAMLDAIFLVSLTHMLQENFVNSE